MPPRHDRPRQSADPSLSPCSPHACRLCVATLHPQQKKHVFLFCLLSSPSDVPTLLFPAPKSATSGFPGTLLSSPPLIRMHKRSCKLPFSGEFSQSVKVLLPGNCHQFGSDKLIKILYRFGHFLRQWGHGKAAICSSSNRESLTYYRQKGLSEAGLLTEEKRPRPELPLQVTSSSQGLTLLLRYLNTWGMVMGRAPLSHALPTTTTCPIPIHSTLGFPFILSLTATLLFSFSNMLIFARCFPFSVPKSCQRAPWAFWCLWGHS